MSRVFRAGVMLCCAILLGGVAAFSAGKVLLDEAEHAPPDLQQMFGERESFHYQVRYGFMRLGDMYVSSSDTVVNGRPLLHLEAVIESNSGIPVMGSRKYSYNSLLARNDSTAYGHYFWVDKLHRDSFKNIEYTFDYENSKVYSSIVDDDIRDTLALVGPADGGMSLFFNGRTHAGTESRQRHPIYIDNELEYITITNTLERETIDNAALGDDIETFLSYGEADINGPFGFSGNFISRYDTSDRRIPVEARASVWIGNVRIRLVDYYNPALED